MVMPQLTFLAALLGILPTAWAYESPRIDAIESPRHALGDLTLYIRDISGRDAQDFVCQTLGYARAAKTELWKAVDSKQSAQNARYLWWPNSYDPNAEDLNVVDARKSNTDIWSRIYCQGPGTAPRWSQKFPVSAVELPGKKQEGRFRPLYAFNPNIQSDKANRAASDLVCRKLGFPKAFFSPTLWKRNDECEKAVPTGRGVRFVRKYDHTLAIDPHTLALSPIDSCSYWEKVYCVYKDLNPETMIIDAVDLEYAEKTLHAVALQMYPQRQEFLRTMAEKFAATRGHPHANEAQIFILLALDPFMRELESAWFKNSVLPIWLRDVPRIARSASFERLGDIRASAEITRAALQIAHAALRTAGTSIAEPSTQAELVEIQKALGIALAATSGDSRGSLVELTAVLKRHASVIRTLRMDPRTAPIAASLQAVSEYLENLR